MTEALRVVAFSGAFLVLFTALGSGPTFALASRSTARLVLCPIVGLAIAASVLTTAALLLPMRFAAWTVLLPGALLSSAVALRSSGRPRATDLREASVPVLLAAVGVLLAAAPAFLRGTAGPFGLGVFDALGYVQADLWLQEHSLLDDPPSDSGRWDLSLLYGHALTEDGTRIGVSVTKAAASTLFGAAPDETHVALLAALFALLPATIWFLSRALGVGKAAAALGACFGLSPAVLSLVADSALANLSALVLTPSVIVLGFRALTSGHRGELILTGLLAAGVVSVYPEFIAPLVGVAVCGVLLLTVRQVRLHQPIYVWIRVVAGRLLLLLALIAVFAPVSFARTLSYLSTIEGDSSVYSGLPLRHLTLENAGAWAFGVLHVYQLPRFDLLSDWRRASALLLPVLLAAVVASSFLQAKLMPVVLILVPIVVPIGVGLLAYDRYQGGACEYCLWKTLTFTLPFLASGLALGAATIWRSVGDFGRVETAVQCSIGLLAVAALAAIGRADLKLIEAQEETPAAVPTSLRELEEDERVLPSGVHLLVEGADASAAPKWTVPATYYFARGLNDARPSMTYDGDVGLYLGLGVLAAPRQLYSPDYTHVLSSFPGLRSRRTLLAGHGAYGLFRRASVDVAVMRTGWSLDPGEGSRAIPWVLNPFELWISSPKPKSARLTLSLTSPHLHRPDLVLHRGTETVPALRASDGARLCANLRLNRGLTVLTVEPRFHEPLPPLPGRATEEDPVPPPLKVLGLQGVEVGEGTCQAQLPDAVPLLRFGRGWQAAEQDFRWMGTRAVLLVGEKGLHRPEVTVTATLQSLARTRLLVARLDGRPVTRLRVPPFTKGSRKLTLTVPAGEGEARLAFRASPPAEPASTVNPSDSRVLAVAFSGVRVRR